ncbi:MAG: helix-turn-helix domain-containing protein [Lachnospiraceae bacterium]|nr:helix-turn-helix domain-containing protein [Lachnospiraceae bacterium]
MKTKQLNLMKQLVTRCITTNFMYFLGPHPDIMQCQNAFFQSTYLMDDFMECLKNYQAECEAYGITTIITSYHVYFTAICLSKEKKEYLFLGPFLDCSIADSVIYDMIKGHGLTIEYARKLKGYYDSIPIYDMSHISGICEVMRNELLNKEEYPKNAFLDYRMTPKDEQDGIAFKLEMEKNIDYQRVEKRYEVEAKVLAAIEEGNLPKAQEIAREFATYSDGMVRAKDPIRNTKNLLIVGNTLYRKAAQSGGVHPVYLDEISAKWAVKIEQANSEEALVAIWPRLLRAYCLLVRNHSLAQYSPIVRRAVTHISLNLGTPLSVAEVAKEVNVCPDYLTRLFKKEVGESVITFINKKRIEASLKLLNTTNLPIQTIGDMVGINDTSYYNKLFKKHIGMAPKQYREKL